MVREKELLLTVHVRITFWGLGDYGTLMVAFFLPVFSTRSWKGHWTIKGSEW